MSGENVAQVILRQLAAWGIKNIYGFIGDDVFYLFDAIAKQQQISLYQVRHEETAALMASAEAKISGKAGVCIADGGPGFIHLLNGLADACIDRVPVLAITGQVSRKDIGTNAKQYLNQQVIMAAISGYSEIITDPEATVKVMDLAYRTALSNNTVSHISVPMDIFSMPCNLTTVPSAPYLTTSPASGPEVVNGALEKIRKSQKPVILVGEGGRNSGELVSELAVRCGAGVITTLAGMGTVSKSHPLYIGGLGHAGSPAGSKLLSEADLCIIVGANWWPSQYVPENIPTIEINNKPANIGSSSPYAYGLIGDSRSILSSIIAGLEKKENHDWRKRIQEEIQFWLSQLEQEAGTVSVPIHPAAVIRALEQVLSEEAYICLDTGDNTVWFGRVFRPNNHRVLISGKWRTMGFALPAALAAKINCPGRQVIALAGDGGFSMNMADFLTAVKYELPVVVVILNNRSLSMEKNKMETGGLHPVATPLLNPDFALYAKSCGGEGFSVTKTEDLVNVFQQSLNQKKPVIIDVIVSAMPVPGTKLI